MHQLLFRQEAGKEFSLRTGWFILFLSCLPKGGSNMIFPKRLDCELDTKVIMTAWSSYQEFLGDEYRMLWVQGWDFESSIKLGHDSKWIVYLRPAQNAASSQFGPLATA